MEKVLIHLCVPSISWEADVFVPVDMPIDRLTDTIANGVADLSNGHFSISSKEMLILKSTEQLLHPKGTLSDYNVQNGEILLLI